MNDPGLAGEEEWLGRRRALTYTAPSSQGAPEGMDVIAVDLARILTAGAAGVASLVAGNAYAEVECAQLAVAEDLPPAWWTAVKSLRAQLAGLPRSDCEPMRISIEPADRAVRVIATARDGRRAERLVRDPDGLAATAMGLLTTIPAETAPEPAPPAPAPPAAATERGNPTPYAVPAGSPPTFGVWAGFGAGVRLTAPTDLSVLDVELRADLLLHRWSLLATFRSAVVSCMGQQGVDCDVYNDVSAGFGVGRRILTGSPIVDVALEPSFVIMHMEYDAPGGGEGQSVEGTRVALRLDASARLAVPLGDRWHITLTLDAGLAPALLASPSRLELPAGFGGGPPPPFPAWTGGVRLGASGVVL